MSKLLVLSLGPVQDFIFAARRTRDLWAGSKLLSDMSRAAAEAVESSPGVNLIFPSRIDPGDDVANIILARCDEADEQRLEAIAGKAQSEVRAVLDEYGKKVLGRFGDYVHRKRFDKQLHTGIEFYSCWVDLGEDYKRSRRELMRLLGGRKACREFVQFSGEAGVPKSSLDGARETVLDEERVRNSKKADVRLPLRMHEGEQLDAMGLVKRAGLGQQHFPSVPRMAADGWLRGARKKFPERLKALEAVCESVAGQDWMQGPNRNRFEKMTATFEYEGGVVFRGRLTDLKDEGAAEGDLERIAGALERLEAVMREPYPYCGVLVADGDYIGAAIGNIDSQPKHQRFSEDLARFARKAKAIVLDHCGSPVFAGGDDVLALVPLDTAIECANCLREAFAAALKEWGQVSLSVGVGIGHCMDSLEDLLRYGRDAEKDAKRGDPERNALAIHFHPRNGQPVKARRQWGTGIVDDLKTAIGYYLDGEFPDGAAYELREMARHYKEWGKHSDLSAAMKADAQRVLGRKASSKAAKTRIGKLLEGRCGSAEELEAFTNELIVARRLAAAYQQSGRRPGEAV